MVRLADGDRSAFQPVFSRAHPVLRQFADRMLAGAPEAEDAAQQALLKVFSRAANFDPGRDALSWMFALTAFECRTLRKRRERQAEEHRLPEVLSEGNPESALSELQLLSLAREVLGELRPADAEALRAAWESAPRPALSGAAFRKRVQRAVERLRVAWRFKHGAE
jgi:RNA polymerase sigma factor (sigma-70 family)